MQRNMNRIWANLKAHGLAQKQKLSSKIFKNSGNDQFRFN